MHHPYSWIINVRETSSDLLALLARLTGADLASQNVAALTVARLPRRRIVPGTGVGGL